MCGMKGVRPSKRLRSVRGLLWHLTCFTSRSSSTHAPIRQTNQSAAEQFKRDTTANHGEQEEKAFPSSVDLLQLGEVPDIQGHVVLHSESHHLVSIDGKMLRCTPTEYLLLLCLLEQGEQPVSFACLVQCGLHSSLDPSTRHCLTQHIGRMRRKLHPFGMHIHSVIGHGYLLQTRPPGPSASEPEAERFSVDYAADQVEFV